jgi:hypothetical protein
MSLQSKAPTETASRVFEEQVQRLPGVMRVERCDDNLTDRKSFRVSVRKGDREARYAVYRLEADMYLRYEGANLDIRVVEEAEAAPVCSDSHVARC